MTGGFEFLKQLEGEASGEGIERNRRVQGRIRQMSPITSYEESNRARRDERTAKRAIKRELPEQVSAKGADVESERCQLIRETEQTRHSSQQLTDIIY